MPKLIAARYGKARVRVLKILREGAIHRIKDIEVATLLEGDFASSYTSGDNSKVVPTDTIKNTINVLAKQHLGDEIERFAVVVAEHFLKRYPQVSRVSIDIAERDWQRLNIGGQPHAIPFGPAPKQKCLRLQHVAATRKPCSPAFAICLFLNRLTPDLNII